MVNSYYCVHKYYRYRTKETIVKEQIRQTSDGAFDVSLPFIDLIICPDYDFAFKREILRQYGIDSDEYRQGNFRPSNDTKNHCNLQDIFNDITQNLHELLYKVKFTTLDRRNRTFVEVFSRENPKQNAENVDVVTKYTNTLGRCYSIRPRAHVVRLGILRVEITARLDIYVYLGYPGQFMYNTKKRVRT